MGDRFSIVGRIHGLAGIVLGVALCAACFVFAQRFAGEGGHAFALASTATGSLVAIAGLAAGIVFRLDQTGRISHGPAGLLVPDRATQIATEGAVIRPAIPSVDRPTGLPEVDSTLLRHRVIAVI